MVGVQSVAQVAFFLVTASVFMHVSARFWLGGAEFRRSLATVLVLGVFGAVLVELQPPLVLAVVFLVSAALVTIQVAYDVGMKESVLIGLVYLVLTAIVGGVASALFRLLG